VAFDIEQPACFYLGREYDLAKREVLPDKYVMYDARDLTTHGVVVGMTGSGKTGLCIALLEEAAIDGIPAVLIDPKGDLTNLLLHFPDLDPKQFAHWLNEEDAQQKGLSREKYAEELAARWRKGLEETGQSPERIAKLKAAAQWRIYTPGSETGLPLSILGSFAAPKGKVPREALTQKIDATATALLGLTGIAADPVQSREHILIAQLLLNSWTAGKDLDLAGLILQIQNPPIRTVGAYNLETFFPAKERLKFASTLNNVLAAPSFSTWTTGEPLDLAAMLTRNGKPQQLIFYTAHLDDTQRMFFTTLLLEEVLNWTRRQSGTTNLRALLYFDEVFGYLPPHPANPPSKGPLLTLLKQGRAFGVGALLATQNPVDLDYKALSNAGTWFIGKLQTDRDKARLLDGLEGVAAEQGTLTDRAYLDGVISALGNRVFVLHNIHKSAPVLFQSRWALSFLRGPLTREQVSELMEPLKESAPVAVQAILLCPWCQTELGAALPERCPKCGRNPRADAATRPEEKATGDPVQRVAAPTAKRVEPVPVPATLEDSVSHMAPVLPPDVTQFYLPVVPSKAAVSGGEIEYQPYVLGFAEVVYLTDKRTGREYREPIRLLAQPGAVGVPLAWDTAQVVGPQLADGPLHGARWATVPESLDTARKLRGLEKAFADHLYSTRKLSLLENRALKLVSTPGVATEAFQPRCRAAAATEAKQALEMEKVKFTPKFEALDAAVPNFAAAKQKSGGSLLDLVGSLFPAKSTDPKEARQQEKLRRLTGDYLAKCAEIEEKWKRVGEESTAIQLKPRKADVRLTHFGLAWAPYWVRPGANGGVERIASFR
jgi:hypothetical protein